LARKHHQDALTFSLTYAFDENFILPLSHDEVVHGKQSLLSKMPGAGEMGFANLRALYGLMYAEPGKKLLFMGGELAERSEWNHDAELGWDLLENDTHKRFCEYVRALNLLYAEEPALHEIEGSWSGFEWIDFSDADRSLVSFIRRGRAPQELLVVVANFTPVVRVNYRLGVPPAHSYEVLFNSDETKFGGTGQRIPKLLSVQEDSIHSRPRSLELTLPPLSVLFLKPRPEPFWSRQPPAGPS
jgi:1,4-alpha-glucan branching enzyme